MLKNTLNAVKTVRSCFATSKQLTNMTSSSVSPLPLLFPLYLRESPENFKSQLYFKSRRTFCSGDSPNKPKGPKAESLELNNDKKKSTESFYEHYSIKEVKSSEAKLLLEIIAKGDEKIIAKGDEKIIAEGDEKIIVKDDQKQELIKKLPKPLLKLYQDLFDLDKGINPKYISTALQRRITSALIKGKFIFVPTKAITQTIFREFNNPNRRLYFTGPTSVGKSCSLALLAIVLRADPNNRIFFIHDTVQFMDSPINRMIAEIHAAFESDFADLSNKEAQELKQKLISIRDQSKSLPGIDDFIIHACTTEVEDYLRNKGLTVHFILDQNNHISRMEQTNSKKASISRDIVERLSSIAIENNGKVVIAASANDQGAPKKNDEFFDAFYLDDIIRDEEGAKFAQLVFDNEVSYSEALAVSDVARNNFGEIKLVSAQKAEKVEDKIELYLRHRTKDIRESIRKNFIEEKKKEGESEKDILDAVYQIMMIHEKTSLKTHLIDTRYIREHDLGYTFLCRPAELAWKQLIFGYGDLMTTFFERDLKNRHKNGAVFGWSMEAYVEYVIGSKASDHPIKLNTDTYKDGKHAKEVVEIFYTKSAYVHDKSLDKSVDKKGKTLHVFSKIEEEVKMFLVPNDRYFPLVDFLILNKSEKKVILIQVKSVLKLDDLDDGQKYLKDAEDAKLNKAAIDEYLGVKKTIFLWIYCDTNLKEAQFAKYNDMNFIQLKDLPDDQFNFNRDLLSANKQIDLKERPY